MRRDATHAEKTMWANTYGRRLKSFVSCIGGNPEGVTHWCAEEGHWKNGTVCVRLCDLVGNWEPAPERTVDCMTCLTRMNKLEESS